MFKKTLLAILLLWAFSSYCQTKNETSIKKDLQFYKLEYKKGNRDIKFIKEYINKLENKVKRPKVKKFSFRFSKYLNPESKKLVLDYISKCPIRQLSEKYIWDLGGEYLLKDVYSNAFEFYQSRLNKFNWGKQDARFQIMKSIDMAVNKEINKLIYPFLNKSNQYILPKYQAEKLNYLNSRFINKKLLSSAQQKIKIKLYHYLRLKNYKKALETIDFCLELNLINSNKNLVNRFLGYIIHNTNNKEIIKSSVKYLTAYAIEEAKGGSIGFNFYDAISVAYSKLGDAQKSKEAKNKSKEMEDKRKARFGDFMKILNQKK